MVQLQELWKVYVCLKRWISLLCVMKYWASSDLALDHLFYFLFLFCSVNYCGSNTSTSLQWGEWQILRRCSCWSAALGFLASNSESYACGQVHDITQTSCHVFMGYTSLSAPHHWHLPGYARCLWRSSWSGWFMCLTDELSCSRRLSFCLLKSRWLPC